MPPVIPQLVASESKPRLRFDRQEWSGAFGDLGTDLPLLVGMILAAGLDATSVLIAFGAMQILTGVWYRLPMPVQPLKAMAAIVIAQKVPASVLYGGGLAIGLAMLLLSAFGVIERVDRLVPKPVIRGIQCGLGLQLSGIALRNYVPADGASGWWLAGSAFLLALLLRGRARIPAGVILAALGLAYAVLFKLGLGQAIPGIGVHGPQLHWPALADIRTGFLLLAIPQIPLSIANSILATRQLVNDFFPERRVTASRISWTYSLMNLINPFVGGVPTCHGSGGMAGHYAFGGRTGGSVVIYGSVYLLLGVFVGPGCQRLIEAFPLPVLGVLLLFEGVTLLALLRDLGSSPADFVLALLLGLLASTVPYGYLVALLLGLAIYHGTRRGWVRLGN